MNPSWIKLIGASFTCEFRVDNKIVETRNTDDYEIWFDKIAEKIYGLINFKQITMKITKNER
ncbi:MAG: hypothetical protein ACTSRT_20085 [Promethearchaeota archaeon]